MVGTVAFREVHTGRRPPAGRATWAEERVAQDDQGLPICLFVCFLRLRNSKGQARAVGRAPGSCECSGWGGGARVTRLCLGGHLGSSSQPPAPLLSVPLIPVPDSCRPMILNLERAFKVIHFPPKSGPHKLSPPTQGTPGTELQWRKAWPQPHSPRSTAVVLRTFMGQGGGRGGRPPAGNPNSLSIPLLPEAAAAHLLGGVIADGASEDTLRSSSSVAHKVLGDLTPVLRTGTNLSRLGIESST